MFKKGFCKQQWKQNWWVIILLIFYILSILSGFSSRIELETVLNLLTILTGLFAIIALVFTALQLREQKNQHKAEMEWQTIQLLEQKKQREAEIEWQKIKIAHGYMKRYNNPVFIKIFPVVAKKFRNFSNDDMANNPKWEELNKDLETKSKIYLFLNFFEEMALMYNKNYLNQKLIKDFFRLISMFYYQKAGNYIRYVQKTSPKEFTEWDTMNENFKC